MKNLLPSLTTFPTSPVVDYTKRHWFKIACMAFLVFIFIKKDFRFQINMKSPIQQESPRHQHTAQQKKETLTENMAVPVSHKTTTKTTFFDRIPFIGGGSSSQKSAAAQELANIDEATKEAYMKRYAHVAVQEQARFGIPASIVLASALLHSQADRRDLAKTGHNHFALRCTSDWSGRSDTYQGTCYRHYKTNWESFRDHSYFITSDAYSHLTELGKKDYKAWAKGLERAGFSEESNLAAHLIQIIEQYRLFDLD